ncbi:hypothetical protein [Streptomyces sp. FL07-04A]|uniref:hypothetical protein n=1 Tax=Streptomyces sp. FL07-04A TaxID=3028658 RepID=UPI0029A0E2BE|nr:hypothetical protein [Streptomyces sp. FL07-04A]MDX3578651.1 hypothetical protein [Streptomyces sp. FL07-04A]
MSTGRVPNTTDPLLKPALGDTVGEPAAIAFCAWHEAYSNTARPVRDTSGARLFACFSCREAYDLAPIADER